MFNSKLQLNLYVKKFITDCLKVEEDSRLAWTKVFNHQIFVNSNLLEENLNSGTKSQTKSLKPWTPPAKQHPKNVMPVQTEVNQHRGNLRLNGRRRRLQHSKLLWIHKIPEIIQPGPFFQGPTHPFLLFRRRRLRINKPGGVQIPGPGEPRNRIGRISVSGELQDGEHIQEVERYGLIWIM